MFNFIGSILAKTGAVIGGVFISIGAFFGGIPPAQEIVPTAPAEEAVIATTTATKDTPQTVSPKTIPVVAEKKKETSPTNQTPIILKETKLEINNVRAIPSSYKISILWNTNVSSNGKVTLWPTETASGNIVVNTINTTSHQVEIQAIPGKTYYYFVESNTTGGQIASSEQKEVTTPVDNVVPIINSVTVNRSTNSSFIDFKIATSESVKITLQYNYSTLMEGEGAFTATSTGIFSENSHVSVRMPDGYFPSTSVISVKITAYDQSLNPSIQYKQTVKIADITME